MRYPLTLQFYLGLSYGYHQRVVVEAAAHWADKRAHQMSSVCMSVYAPEVYQLRES